VAAKQTTVIIVNWNGALFLDQLLESIRGEQVAKTIVIDNASQDDSLGILAAHQDIHVIRNPENRGYGAAANQGIEHCDTPFLLLLNVDVKVCTGSISAMETYLLKNPAVALVSPQLLFPDGSMQPSIRSFPTAASLAIYLAYLDRIFPSGYRKKLWEHRRSDDVDQPMGAAMMLRKSVLEEVEGFDPQFFLYMEEVDLCYRIKQKGYRIAYLPEAQVIHHAGGSSQQDWDRSQSLFLNSVRLYFEKHAPAEAQKLRKLLPPALFFRALVLLCLGHLHQSKFYFRKALERFSDRGKPQFRP
jgi:GT2 family glycosyltransferase